MRFKASCPGFVSGAAPRGWSGQPVELQSRRSLFLPTASAVPRAAHCCSSLLRSIHSVRTGWPPIRCVAGAESRSFCCRRDSRNSAGLFTVLVSIRQTGSPREVPEQPRRSSWRPEQQRRSSWRLILLLPPPPFAGKLHALGNRCCGHSY
jgi:hypothetical protein